MWHRQVSRQLFHRCGGMPVVRWLRRKGVTILMYHKFPADPGILESQCRYLRKHYQVISLGRLSQLLRNGDPLPDWSVVITVDDGHGSFYRYAYPVFAKFDFPVTVYLTTRPLDTRGWLWFDRVAYAFLTSRRQEVDLPNPPSAEGVPSAAGRTAHSSMPLGSKDQRLALAEQYMELMKGVPNKYFSLCLKNLESSLGVQVPDEAPQEWAALSWDEVRLMARDKVEFGAHSVTHPILTHLAGKAQIEQEIRGSKDRIEAVLDRPISHFAFPNGQPQDISDQVLQVVRDTGFQTAVTTSCGQVHRGDNPYLLKRIACEAAMPDYQFRQHVAAFRVS
jgi:peptidoglycan/xylan/chitin deacetylase (PgdA/CDA1 family)